MARHPTMTNADIAGLLREYAQAKERVRELRAEMMRLAVEELGMDQSEAMKVDLPAFLDGYLVGQGVQQSWRSIGVVGGDHADR